MSSSIPAPTLSSMLDDPVRTMLAKYQHRSLQQDRKRLSYPREYNLAAIKRKAKAGKTRYRVAKDLSISESMLGKWVFQQRLYPRLVTVSPKGRVSYGGFHFSRSWFSRFARRPRKRTQQQPDRYRPAVQSFHQFIRKVAEIEDKDNQTRQDIGKYKLENIANMDQIPMPFEVGTVITYNETGARTVWVESLGSGWDKRQATVQLTVHADGKAHTQPMIVFCGKGLRITHKEQKSWDKRVSVKFQENAWVDETIGLQWIRSVWRQCTLDPRLLVLDVHKAHRTPQFLRALSLRNTIPAFVPPRCTRLVQPLSVALNKPFKDLVDIEYNTHFEANPDSWVPGKLSASERRILMTKWIGSAWETFCKNHEDTIKASFVECGIAVAIDGTEDALIHVRGLDNYEVPPWRSNPGLNSEADPEPESQAGDPLRFIQPYLQPDLDQEFWDCDTEGTLSCSEFDSSDDGSIEDTSSIPI